jgi:hypothetical protein
MTTTPGERLKEAAEKLRDVNIKIGYVNETSAKLSEEKERLEVVVLPELFAEAGVVGLELGDGSKLKLSSVASGSLPKEEDARKKAIALVVEYGWENLI